MINFHLKLLRKFNFQIPVSRRNYSEVYGNIVKLSEDLQIKEIKVPFEETSVIYYGENDSIEALIPRLKASNEKIQKVDFYQFNTNNRIEETENFQRLSISPFEIRINNHHSIYYLPSLNRFMDANVKGFGNINVHNRNSFNFALKKIMLSNGNKEELKKELKEKLDELIKVYEKYEDEMNKKDKIIKDRYLNSQKRFVRLSILYFALHLGLFYLLIYQLYGWDEIEPITYIVGNIYWIIGLAFFIKYKKKLDVPFFFSKNFADAHFSKQCQLLGFNRKAHDFTQNYLKQLKSFNQVIDKI